MLITLKSAKYFLACHNSVAQHSSVSFEDFHWDLQKWKHMGRCICTVVCMKGTNTCITGMLPIMCGVEKTSWCQCTVQYCFLMKVSHWMSYISVTLRHDSAVCKYMSFWLCTPAHYTQMKQVAFGLDCQIQVYLYSYQLTYFGIVGLFVYSPTILGNKK